MFGLVVCESEFISEKKIILYIYIEKGFCIYTTSESYSGFMSYDL